MLPSPIAHIARDPFDPEFDQAAAVARIKTRRTGIKRALLDQTLVSGIGNIYADEALWAAKVHGETAPSSLTKPRISAVIDAARVHVPLTFMFRRSCVRRWHAGDT